MATIEERMATVENENKNQDNQIELIAKDIREIKEKLLARPSWSVMTIITLLTTVCASLAVFILTR